MTQTEQINAFQADLQKLITRYTAEYDLSLASAVGVLEIVKLDLVASQKPEVPKGCEHVWRSYIPNMYKCEKCGARRPA